ncbi:MAG TPA: dTDP-glucose 4,6-dehydratase [candidate division Zixibacteria bacterium]|nr:dTDP-glucose 4,6-dehydratase [candidate division Zixibacteria bacterium]
MHQARCIAVTGGAGFIGSNLLLYLVPRHPEVKFINIDCLTYAANLTNLKSLESSANYVFERIDIRDSDALRTCFDRHEVDGVIHLAAESHVDRSIIGPQAFIETNINGTFNLLEQARQRVEQGQPFRFHHVSTDEVFGSLGTEGFFNEQSPYRPNSPYSASKAAADHLVRSYHRTYGLDCVITNCSNNYGPYQFPEKLIPLMIRNALRRMPLPVYGDGGNIRDWLYVDDHCRALELVFDRGEAGKTYVIGGHNEITNIELVRKLIALIRKNTDCEPLDELIQFVADRPGHDRRYAIDASYIETALGWKPQLCFEDGLRHTVEWYLNNQDWIESCISGEYRQYYERMYGDR